MIGIFLISLFATFVLVRIGAYFWHDQSAFNEKGWRGYAYDKSKTITGWLRRKTKRDIHHFHIGAVLFIASIVIISIFKINKYTVSYLAMSLSLMADQPIPLKFYRNNKYFSKKSFLMAIFFHIGIALLAFVLFRNYFN